MISNQYGSISETLLEMLLCTVNQSSLIYNIQTNKQTKSMVISKQPIIRSKPELEEKVSDGIIKSELNRKEILKEWQNASLSSSSSCWFSRNCFSSESGRPPLFLQYHTAFHFLHEIVEFVSFDFFGVSMGSVLVDSPSSCYVFLLMQVSLPNWICLLRLCLQKLLFFGLFCLLFFFLLFGLTWSLYKVFGVCFVGSRYCQLDVFF